MEGKIIDLQYVRDKIANAKVASLNELMFGLKLEPNEEPSNWKSFNLGSVV
jgi:hypothetical protein